MQSVRRRISACWMVAFALLLVMPSVALAAWPQFMGGPTADGYSPFVGPDKTKETAPAVYVGTAEANTAVQAENGEIFVHTWDGLKGYDPATGQVRVLGPIQGNGFMTPVLAPYGLVTRAGYDLVCINTDTGDTRWRVPSGFQGFHLTMDPVSGDVFDYTSGVVRRISDNGTATPTVTPLGTFSVNGNFVLSADGSVLYVAESGAGHVHAIDLSSGGELAGWPAPASYAGAWASMSVGVDGTLYVPENYSVRALASDGTQSWVFSPADLYSAGLGNACVADAHDGTLRVLYWALNASLEDETRLAVISAGDGTLLNEFVCDIGGEYGDGPITVDSEGKAYFAAHTGVGYENGLYCVDAAGQLVFKYAMTANAYYAAPVIDASGAAYWYENRSGEIRTFANSSKSK